VSRGGGRAVLFEFIRVGAYVKVIAVDERTGIEVSIVGDPTRSSDYLERVAMQKLRRVLEKQSSESNSGKY
tara:strand:+ start:298 stop:510 length:213 start_codon:yes stop_codon:yes gene_type:complete